MFLQCLADISPWILLDPICFLSHFFVDIGSFRNEHLSFLPLWWKVTSSKWTFDCFEGWIQTKRDQLKSQILPYVWKKKNFSWVLEKIWKKSDLLTGERVAKILPSNLTTWHICRVGISTFAWTFPKHLKNSIGVSLFWFLSKIKSPLNSKGESCQLDGNALR